MSKQVEMLDKIFEVLLANGRKPEEAYHDLLHFIGYRIGIESVTTPGMALEVNEQINAMLDIELLKEARWDWLGELYSHRQLSGKYGSFYVPTDQVESVAVERVNSLQERDVIPGRMLDVCTGSGRLILAVYNRVGRDLIYYGAEMDLIAYRTALINMHLYDIPARILHCNTMETNLSAGSVNWKYANKWEPTAQKGLETIAL